MEPSAPVVRAGDLLVAAPGVSDGVFDQTVVLVLDADADGALGVVLNEEAAVELADVLPEWQGRVCPPAVLFSGGPVSPNGAICLAEVADPAEEPPGWRRLFGDVGLLHLDTPVEITVGAYRRLRIFAGYAGWAPGQLELEIAEGTWFVVGAEGQDAFGDDPWTLWRRVLRRQPSSLRWFATWTDDPEAN